MAKKEKGNPNTSVPVRGNGQQNASEGKRHSMSPMPLFEHPLGWLRHEMNAVFDRFFGANPQSWGSGEAMERFWDTDVEENDNEIVVRAAAPGFEPNEFDINVTGNTLNIRAEHKEETEDKAKGRWERRYGSLQRMIPLSTEVNADDVQAQYRSGVLEVHLPRTSPVPRKRIEVKAEPGK